MLTDEEFAARRASVDRQLEADNSEFDVETADRSTAGQVGSATSPPPHWLERGLASRRTSLVIDPPDGRIPALTPEGEQRAQTGRGTFVNGSFSNAAFNGPKDLSLWERCITRGLPGAMFPTVYNANVAIVQGPGVVAITYEMIHDTRVIPTDGSPPLAPADPRVFRQLTRALGRRHAGRGRRQFLPIRRSIAARVARCTSPSASRASATCCTTRSRWKTRRRGPSHGRRLSSSRRSRRACSSTLATRATIRCATF